MKITNAQYFNDVDGNKDGIKAEFDGVLTFVPIHDGIRHYIEIKRQLDAGDITIKDADVHKTD